MTTAMPRIAVYPLCSECKAPYVLRRALQISTGKEGWVWQRDCKHKNAAPLTNKSLARAEGREP